VVFGGLATLAVVAVTALKVPALRGLKQIGLREEPAGSQQPIANSQ
jgi:hypothetical protein